MPTWVRRVVKGTLIVKAIGVALVVLAIVGFQVLINRLPAHQEEVKAWVAQELGLELEFASLDASWSWRGPELVFGDTSVTTVGDTTPFVRAREVSVGFNAFSLLTQLAMGREVDIDRLTFEGTELALLKTAEGTYRLQGAPAAEAELSFRVPPDIEVLVRNSRVLYLDPALGISWDFADVAGSMRRNGDVVTLEASAAPPLEFARRIELRAQASIADVASGSEQKFTGNWRLSVEFAEVDLGVVARLLPASADVPQAGSGDVAMLLEWQNDELVSGNVQLALADVQLPGNRGGLYEQLAFKGDWQHDGDAWHAALRDVAVTRAGRSWPTGTTIDIDVSSGALGKRQLGLRGSFLRVEDVIPVAVTFGATAQLGAWATLEPRGDVRDLDVTVARDVDGSVDYAVAGEFAEIGIAQHDGIPGFSGLSGQIRADTRSGRLELASLGATLDWPSLFRDAIDAPELRGIIVWRAGQDTVRFVSDDLLVVTPDATLRSNLELTLPMDGASPELDMRMGVSGFDLAAVRRYLPARKMPSTVVDWLDAALLGGRAQSAEVVFAGPLRSFPFDGGEGELRASVAVEGGRLAFAEGWPVAEDLDGSVEFVNAAFSARGSGRVLGNRTADVRVDIPDLRAGELTVKGATIGPLGDVLGFLNDAPLIADYLGKDFARLESPSGTGEVDLDLLLPLRDRSAYRLTASLNIIDGELAYRGFAPRVTEIQGRMALADGVLHGEGIEAIFLDGPVVARVDSALVPGYRARIELSGEVTIDAVANAFTLPYADLLAGQTTWQGTLLIPAAEGAASLPPRITVHSNLSGVAMRLPAPFAKAPSDPTNLEVDLRFPEGGLQMEGYLGATRRFAVDFDADPNTEGKFVFQRAALRFGGALPSFRFDNGISFDGSLPVLRIDDWLALSRGAVGQRARWSDTFSGADLDVAEFSIFGQQLGSTKIVARRRTDDWQFELDSDAIAGTLLVPVDLASDPQVVAVMRRLYLNAGDGSGTGDLDPRELPGLQLHADEFGVGQRQIGRLDAEILSDALGLRLVSFESVADGFTAQGSGGWFMGPEGVTTRFALSVNSSDVAKMLDKLGFAPFVAAKSAEVTASVYWSGPPSAAWLDHLNGDFALRVEDGSIIDVEPGGAGRAIGLLSISALPRRLALDFRDVFNRGLVFDDITADFVVVDGNAYTDNLKLTGPVAEVGIIGRTGLRDHDYGQQAVVTAEPGKMLPTVGALIGGPTVAAALLIFTRLFKKPLGGIGRASYCVTGSWQDPMVERLTAEQLEQGSLCAELPPNGALQRPAEVAAR